MEQKTKLSESERAALWTRVMEDPAKMRAFVRSMVQRRPSKRVASYEDAEGRKHELLAVAAGQKDAVRPGPGRGNKRRCLRVVLCDRPAKRGRSEPLGAVAVLGNHPSETRSVGALIFDYLESAQLEVVPGFREVTPDDLCGVTVDGPGLGEPEYRNWEDVERELLGALREDLPFEAPAESEPIEEEFSIEEVMEAVPA